MSDVPSPAGCGASRPEAGASPPEHVDVLIIGAGLSGIGAACRLRTRLPRKRVLILEARDAIGGTWDLFRYPGIRSDSDMFTLGYDFRPWDGADSIADGASIRTYIEQTAAEYGVTDLIRFRRRVESLSWSSDQARWTARIRDTDGGTSSTVTADFVYGCTGYYRYDEGYRPDFPGMDDYQGTLIHPQHWPEELDVSGQRVVVIGSGATAVTLVPALARTADHVTMLQRSPSYVISRPSKDTIADWLRDHLPARIAHRLIKWKNVFLGWAMFRLSRRRPELVKTLLRKALEAQLPDDFDIDTHFTPAYDPWDQRLCLVPDSDLFAALGSGRASIVTDTTERFVADGVQLGSGRTLPADVVVTATGLNLLMMGGIEFEVDGRPIDVTQAVAYKGLMLSDVPNFAFATGYTNASWTLKVDLATDYVCRLLAHMDRNGYRQVTPQAPPPSEPTRPLIDLTSGYVLRSLDQLPRQGTRTPWQVHQNYARDVLLFRRSELDDEGVVFTRTPAESPTLARASRATTAA